MTYFSSGICSYNHTKDGAIFIITIPAVKISCLGLIHRKAIEPKKPSMDCKSNPLANELQKIQSHAEKKQSPTKNPRKPSPSLVGTDHIEI